MYLYYNVQTAAKDIQKCDRGGRGKETGKMHFFAMQKQHDRGLLSKIMAKDANLHIAVDTDSIIAIIIIDRKQLPAM